MLICDQCEREFHIGCLAKHMQEVVTEIPQGSWYCSSECKHVSHVLQDCVRRGEIPVPGANGDHTWQVSFAPDATCEAGRHHLTAFSFVDASHMCADDVSDDGE